MTKGELSIGQTVYLEPYGNFARYHKDIIEAKIEKIGRLYFTVKGIDYRVEEEYEIKTLSVKEGRYTYNQGYNLYFSMQEILDKNEKFELTSKFRKFFDWSGNCRDLTLEQLRQIDKIIAP